MSNCTTSPNTRISLMFCRTFFAIQPKRSLQHRPVASGPVVASIQHPVILRICLLKQEKRQFLLVILPYFCWSYPILASGRSNLDSYYLKLWTIRPLGWNMWSISDWTEEMYRMEDFHRFPITIIPYIFPYISLYFIIFPYISLYFIIFPYISLYLVGL